MTPKQAKRCLDLLTQVQMMCRELPKGKSLQAYNKLSQVKIPIKRNQQAKVKRHSVSRSDAIDRQMTKMLMEAIDGAML